MRATMQRSVGVLRRCLPMSSLALAPILALTMTLVAGAALAETPATDGSASNGSFRAAQEEGLDLSLRPVDLLNVDPGAAPGSFRAAQDAGKDAWSKPMSQKWALEGYQGPGGPPAWDEQEEPVGVKLMRRF